MELHSTEAQNCVNCFLYTEQKSTNPSPSSTLADSCCPDANDSILTRVLDEKVYELKDHLGNVRVVISDVKEPTTQSGEAPFGVTLRRYTNYYPFGMAQPGRQYAAPAGGEYRYGYQGQEGDRELGGDGQTWHYRFRVHDPRIGRFFSIDKKADEYLHYAPYAFSGNRVIDAVEIEGLQPGVLFPTADAAALDFGRLFNDNSIRDGYE